MNREIADLRNNYSQKSLSENEVSPNPIDQFKGWWSEALHAEVYEANAMTLATADAQAMPDARIVLLKDITAEGWVFFTNYESAKGHELNENPRACLVFFWKELERQVRVSGWVTKVSEAESAAYFFSRPEGSQVSAIVSPQSRVIPNRAFLEVQTKMLQEQIKNGASIMRPDHWGGYLVKPFRVEFWQGRPNRLHDRIVYTLHEKQWQIERLAP